MNTENYKAKLEEERATLLAELANLGKRGASVGEWATTPDAVDPAEADSNTQADRFESFEENSAVMVQLETRLQEIEDAISKISEDKYGICEVCNSPIESARLEANPAAKTCMTHINNS